jgi:hypothetical protein
VVGEQMKMHTGMRRRNLLQSGFLEDREEGWRTASIKIGHSEIQCKNRRSLKVAEDHVSPSHCITQAVRQSLNCAVSLKDIYEATESASYWLFVASFK